MELTQVANGQVTKIHLCEQCAAERGLENTASVGKSPLASYIAAMGQGINDAAPAGTDLTFLCRSCGATLQDFRESGRLGCPDCYRTLGEPLRELLRRLHGATRHTGERYAASGSAPVEANMKSSLELREQLKRAIESEDFELAAQLRDQLKVVE
jgi:protein arginine kinase activator